MDGNINGSNSAGRCGRLEDEQAGRFLLRLLLCFASLLCINFAKLPAKNLKLPVRCLVVVTAVP